jgi:hemerythrin-like domain-containing protein
MSSRISETLHEDHAATIAFAERLEALMVKHARKLPDRNEPAVAQVLRDLPLALDAEISRHFAFEEARLFPVLADNGDVAIGNHLTDEHNAMRPLAARLVALGLQAQQGGFSELGWQEFRVTGAELCERMVMHVQKEEMVLLPLLEETLDPQVDAELYGEYTGNT